MKSFYNDYENLKFRIRNFGLSECENDIDKMIQDYSNHRNIGLVLLKKAQLERNLKNYQNAESIYLQIIDSCTNDIKLFASRDLFKIYIDQGRIEEALILFEKLEIIETDKYELLFSKSLLLRVQGKNFESSRILSSIIKNVDKIDNLNFLQNCLLEIEKNYWDDFKRNNYNSIKSIIKKLTINSNRRIKVRRNLELAHLEQINGNYSEALKLYRIVLNCTDLKNRSIAIIGICKTYLLLGDQNILNSIEFEELKTYEYPEAIYLLAQIYSMNNNYNEAIKILDSTPINCRVIYEKARVFRTYKNYDESIVLFNKCFEESNSFTLKTSSLFNLIYIYIDLNDYEKAFELLTKNEEKLINLDKTSYYQIYAFLCKYFNIEYDSTYNSYSVSQVLNYNFELTCEHVKKHINEFKEVIDFDNISNLLLEISDKLSIKTYFTLTFFDVYNVRYTGKDGRDFFIKTIVIPGTKNIITCFPSKETLFVLDDIDEEIDVKPKEKVIQRKSQIDKFNERYSMKRG